MILHKLTIFQYSDLASNKTNITIYFVLAKHHGQLQAVMDLQ